MDGRLDVLGDGGGALVVAGLVPVEPTHVVRLHGAQVAPQLVRQAPPSRGRRLLPSSYYSHASVHLHHHRRRKPDSHHARAHSPVMEATRQGLVPHRGKADDEVRCGVEEVGFCLCFALLWFVYAATSPRGREAERGGTTTTPGWQCGRSLRCGCYAIGRLQARAYKN